MSERPTPAEIANALDVALQALGGTGGTFDRVEWLRDRLRSGAVIVHPDDDVDVEPLEWPNDYLRQQAYDLAVERTRRAIFGGSHE